PLPPVAFDTVTLIDAVAVLPAASVAVNASVCVPLAVVVVSHVVDTVVSLTLWLKSVVVLSSFSRNWVGAWAFLTIRLTALLTPPSVAPLAGLVIAAVIAGGGVGPGLQAAPDATAGVVASLMIVTGVDAEQFPKASVATACTRYAPGG